MDADGLLEHSDHIAEARAKLFRDFADGHTMTFYAEPSPALAEAIDAMPPGAVELKQFAFLQGLDADIKVLQEA